MEIANFNIVDGSNNASDQFPENMPFANVNDNMRAVLGALARWIADTDGTLLTTGTSGAYALTSNRTGLTLVNGLHLSFRANHRGSTSAATLTLTPSGGAALTTKNIVDVSGNNIPGDRIVPDQIYTVIFGVDVDAFVLVNSAAGYFSSTTDIHTLAPFSGAPGVVLDETPATNLADIRLVNGSNAATLSKRLNYIELDGGGSLTLSAEHSGALVVIGGLSSSVTITLDTTFTGAFGAYFDVFFDSAMTVNFTISDGTVINRVGASLAGAVDTGYRFAVFRSGGSTTTFYHILQP